MSKIPTKQYYDWYDIAAHFGFKDIQDVFEPGVHYYSNGAMVSLYEPYLEKFQDTEGEDFYRAKNRKKIYDELGECKIHVWW